MLFPERNIGIALQMNSEDIQVMRGLALRAARPLPRRAEAPTGSPRSTSSWTVADRRRPRGARCRAQKRGEAAQASRRCPLAGYAGRYADPWYGPIEITRRIDKGALRVNFTQTPRHDRPPGARQHDTFRTVWDDRNIEPAYVTFALDAEGKVERITLKAVSPIADFSFDYQDLLFTPVRR